MPRRSDAIVCARCARADGVHPAEYWFAFLVGVCGRHPSRARWLNFQDWCREHDWFPDHVEARDAWGDELRRRSAPFEIAAELAVEAHRLAQLEVNHVIPCLGAHKANSCLHHLDGLVTLCHPCHVVETNRQRRAGLLAAS